MPRTTSPKSSSASALCWTTVPRGMKTEEEPQRYGTYGLWIHLTRIDKPYFLTYHPARSGCKPRELEAYDTLEQLWEGYRAQVMNSLLVTAGDTREKPKTLFDGIIDNSGNSFF